jgi:hypothetical protein
VFSDVAKVGNFVGRKDIRGVEWRATVLCSVWVSCILCIRIYIDRERERVEEDLASNESL